MAISDKCLTVMQFALMKRAIDVRKRMEGATLEGDRRYWQQEYDDVGEALKELQSEISGRGAGR